MPRKCAKEKCSKQPNYGVSGSRKAEYCSEHALEGMVHVYSRKCSGGGWSKRANSGVSGSRKIEYCAGHALEGMFDTTSKKCAGDGCSKYPSYGVSGSGKREYCAEHALEGMVDISSRKCTWNGCSKRANYGVSRSRKRVLRRTCFGRNGRYHFEEMRQDGCSKIPSYGVSRTRKREYCAEHALEGMISPSSSKYSKGRCSTKSRHGVSNATEREDVDEGYSTMPLKRMRTRKQMSISKTEVRASPAGATEDYTVKVEFHYNII